MNDYSRPLDSIRAEVADDQPISVTEYFVARRLLALNVFRASGLDNLPNWVFKKFAYISAAPVDDILNTSFSEGMGPWSMETQQCLSST